MTKGISKHKLKKFGLLPNTKKIFFVFIMAIAMVAMLAFGGTYAFFTAKSNVVLESDGITAGHIEISTGSVTKLEKAFEAAYAVPGNTLWDLNISVDTTKTNVDSYVFAKWTLDEGGVVLTVDKCNWTQLKNGETPVEGVYYKEVGASETAVAFTTKVVFATSNGNDAQDAVIDCGVTFHAAQKDYMTPYEAAQACGLAS